MESLAGLNPGERHVARCGDTVLQGAFIGAAGRRLPDFGGSAYRSLLRMGELTASSVNSSLSVFSFDHEWPFSFRQDEKKMGIQSSAA